MDARRLLSCAHRRSPPTQVTTADFYFEHDPYANLTLRPPDEHGWGANAQVYAQLVNVLHPSLVVEVGVWKGRSTLQLARELKQAGHGVVVAVDTWLGSIEFWTRLEQSGRKMRAAKVEERDLRLQNGYPSVFYTFLSNVVHAAVQPHVVPCPMGSLTAALF